MVVQVRTSATHKWSGFCVRRTAPGKVMDVMDSMRTCLGIAGAEGALIRMGIGD